MHPVRHINFNHLINAIDYRLPTRRRHGQRRADARSCQPNVV